MRRIQVGIINDTRNAHHMGCWLVMQNLFRLLREHGIKVQWCWPTGRDWREDRHAHRRGNVDLVLVNAEGSIHDSHEHHLAERFSSIAGYFKSRFRVPCVLINSTLHNNEPFIYELLSDYSLIFTRDSASSRLLASRNIDAQKISDLTLAFPAKLSDKVAPTRRAMITDSACPGTSRRLKHFAHSIESAYRPIQFARFPHANRLGKPRVYLGLARRWAEDKIRHRPGLHAYLKSISSSSVVITGRYHVVTMCLLTRTPFLAVESLVPKISWLLQDVFGATERVFPDLETLVDRSDWQSTDWSEDEKMQLDAYLATCERSNQRMLERIRQII